MSVGKTLVGHSCPVCGNACDRAMAMLHVFQTTLEDMANADYRGNGAPGADKAKIALDQFRDPRDAK